MKKLGLALVTIVAIATIYYVTLGSAQVVEKIKTEVNNELGLLQKSGFKVEEREASEKKDSFVLTFDDPQKITNYLVAEGESISVEDITLLKGMKLKMDMEYLPTTTDSISIDIYPISLPTNITKDLGIDENSKSLQAIREMIKEKAFMAHINFNKLLSGFDGYVKDIDKTFKDTQDSHLLLKGLTFKGNMDDKTITGFNQKLETFAYELTDKVKVKLSKADTSIDSSDKKTDIDYHISSIDLKINDEKKSFDVMINNITGESKDTKRDTLLDNKSQFKIASVNIKDAGKESILNNIEINSVTKNLDMKALEKLQNYSGDQENPDSIKEFIPILKAFTKSDMVMDISKISVESITSEGKTFEGLNISALLKLNKDFKWDGVEANPMMLLQLPNVKANIELSNEIFSMIAQTPQAMMLMMMAQPVDKNGKKVYDIEFNQGSLKLNGKPLM